MVEPCHAINVQREWLLFFLHHDQVCCVEFDRKDINMNKLVATSLEGKFHVFDMRTQHVTKGFASVSEKVIDLGGDSQTDVWLICMGYMSKGYYHHYYHLYCYLYGSEWNGCTCPFDRFHSWKCLGLCLSNILCGFVTWAKNDTEQVRRKKCVFLCLFFLWETVRQSHLNRH